VNWQHRVTGLRSSDLQRQYNDVVCTAREGFKRNNKPFQFISRFFLQLRSQTVELRLARNHVVKHALQERVDIAL